MTKPFKITFCGDTSLGYYYLEKSKNKYSEAYSRLQNDPFSFFEGVAPLLEDSDEVIINLETVLTNNPGAPIEGKEYPGFDDPDVTIEVLKKLGTTAVTLANNHAMDFGEDKLIEMIDLLHANGIATIGAGRNIYEARKPYIITVPESGEKVYIFNCMRSGKRYREYGFFAEKEKPGIANTSLSAVKKQIQKIKEIDPKAIVVVCPHWQGVDYQEVDEIKKQWCRDVINAGADTIVAHGSHKKDEVEECSGKKIYFSIGNFVFNSPGRYASKGVRPFSSVVSVNLKQKKLEFLTKDIMSDNQLTNFNVAVVEERGGEGEEQESHDYKEISLMFEKLMENPSNKDLSDRVPAIIQEKLNKSSREFYRTRITRGKMLGTNRYSKDKVNQLISCANPDHITHGMLRHIEKRKMLLERSVSFHTLMMQGSAERRFGIPDYSWELDDKKKAYRFADLIGIKRPNNDGRMFSFHEIEEPKKPAVIKPAAGTGSRGVIFYYSSSEVVLLREDVKFSSWDEMVSYVNDKVLYNKGNIFGIKGKWSIEEFVLEDIENKTPARDLKFYTFYGRVFAILEIVRGSNVRHCFWSRDGQHLKNTGHFENETWVGDGVTEEEVKYVEDISLNIPAPYMRIDMLKGESGMILGEFTPRPGQWDKFNKEYDFRLGKEFIKARRRLLDDLILGKNFEKFNKLREVL
ncbi:CapA family protein [Halomonas sp. AOP5-B2-8]